MASDQRKPTSKLTEELAEAEEEVVRLVAEAEEAERDARRARSAVDNARTKLNDLAKAVAETSVKSDPRRKPRRHRVPVERSHQHTNLEDFARMVRAKYTEQEIRDAFRVLVQA